MASGIYRGVQLLLISVSLILLIQWVNEIRLQLSQSNKTPSSIEKSHFMLQSALWVKEKTFSNFEKMGIYTEAQAPEKHCKILNSGVILDLSRRFSKNLTYHLKLYMRKAQMNTYGINLFSIDTAYKCIDSLTGKRIEKMNIILAKFPEIPPTTFIILNILILVFARRWYFRKGSSEEFLGGISVTKFTNTIDRGLNKSPTTCLLDGEEASLKGNLCLERTEKKIHEPINCYLKRCVSVFQLEEALQSKSANPAIKKFEADVHFVGPKSKKIDDLNLQRNSNSNYKLNDIIKARTDINIHDASKPIPTVLNYPAIDKKGKRMKRIFIPGRGWISVKTLEREKYDLFRTCLL